MSRNARKAGARPPSGGFRGRLHEVIFEADTRAGRAFDVVLIGLILLSVLAVMLESLRGVREHYGSQLYAAEWAFTVLFTVEYALRLASVRRPLRYAALVQDEALNPVDIGALGADATMPQPQAPPHLLEERESFGHVVYTGWLRLISWREWRDYAARYLV